MPKLTDPDFTFPNGQTVAEMETWHQKWNDDHDYHPERDRLLVASRAPAPIGPLVTCINCGEEMAAFVLGVHRALRH